MKMIRPMLVSSTRAIAINTIKMIGDGPPVLPLLLEPELVDAGVLPGPAVEVPPVVTVAVAVAVGVGDGVAVGVGVGVAGVVMLIFWLAACKTLLPEKLLTT